MNTEKLDIIKLAEVLYNGRNIAKFPKSNRTTKSEFQSVSIGSISFETHTEEEVKSILGRKWKVALSRMVPVLKYLDKCKQEQIALSSEELSKKYRIDARKVRRTIEDCISIEILKRVSDYCYTENRCYVYVCNRDMLNRVKKMLDIREDNNISMAVTFAEPIRISQKCCLPLELSDEQIEDGLRKQYPFLKHYQEMADEINSKYFKDNPELWTKFSPSIRRTKTRISKVGIRATNGIVSKKAHLDDGSTYEGEGSRSEYLKSYFRTDSFSRYDFKASVYRITYFLNRGEWLDRSIDLYSYMSGYSNMTKEQRTAFKHMCMLLYFTKSVKEIIRNNNKALDDYDTKEVEEVLDNAKQRMNRIIGESRMSEIFLYESCIYMGIFKELLDRGIKVVQIYDEFISDDDVLEEEVEEIIRSKINQILESVKDNNISMAVTFALDDVQLKLYKANVVMENADKIAKLIFSLASEGRLGANCAVRLLNDLCNVTGIALKHNLNTTTYIGQSPVADSYRNQQTVLKCIRKLDAYIRMAS